MKFFISFGRPVFQRRRYETYVRLFGREPHVLQGDTVAFGRDSILYLVSSNTTVGDGSPSLTSTSPPVPISLKRDRWD